MPTVNGDFQSSNTNISQGEEGGLSITSVERQFKQGTSIAGIETAETLQDNDVLQYDAASNKWQAQSVEVATGTDTRTNVSDSGTAVVSNVEDINLASLLDVADDGDNTVTVDVNDDLSQFDNTTSGFITDYTVTETDVTQHESALTITESQISDLSHYTSTDFDTDFGTKTTDDLSEGSNLYYTDARVDGLIVDGTNVATTFDSGAGTLTIDAGATSVTRNTQNAVASSISTSSDDYYIGVDSSAGAFTVTLSSADATDGRELVIHDDGGNAATNNVTIDTEGTETISGEAFGGGNTSIALTSNFQSVKLRSDGSNWFVV